MTKNEFMEYKDFLEKTLEIKTPTDKEVLQSWYEPFANIHLEIAKKMAKMYLQKEQGYFKLGKLLEYKNAAMAGAEYKQDTRVSCNLCKGTGFVQIETKLDNYPYPILNCKRCLCKAGQVLKGDIAQVSKSEVESMGMYPTGVFYYKEVKNERD